MAIRAFHSQVPAWKHCDVIGDVHGCIDELLLLLAKLGYTLNLGVCAKLCSPRVLRDCESERVWAHPENRVVIFVGDLVDRGPSSLAVLHLAILAQKQDLAYCVNGNHEDRFRRWLLGNAVKVQHGLETTKSEMALLDDPPIQSYVEYLNDLPTHLILDSEKLIVAHAGIEQKDIGRDSQRVRARTMYGKTTGETDMDGYPIRIQWADEYDGSQFVAYGHTPVLDPLWIGETVNLDTGCVFGGRLSALRWPMRETVSVKAKRTYCASPKHLRLFSA